MAKTGRVPVFPQPGIYRGATADASSGRWFDMNLIALRITGPRPREKYLAERRDPPVYPGGAHLYVTDEQDLANAYLGALDAVQIGHGRFDAVFIAGDEAEAEHNLSKAKRLLGWEPKSQRLLE